MKRIIALFSGILLGGVAGYISGILTAPRSGKETREHFKNKAVLMRDRSRLKIREAKVVVNEKKQEVQDSLVGKATRVISNTLGRSGE